MILVLTDSHDSHADAVLRLLEEASVPFFRLNLEVAALKKTLVTFDGSAWTITQGGKDLVSEDVKSVWHRRSFVELLLDEQNVADADFKIWKNEWNKTLTGLYLHLSGARWVNDIRASYRAENKYLQRLIAHEVGLKTPEIIVSNNRHELLSFSTKHGEVALKLMSQEFYEMPDGQFKGIYVNKLTAAELVDFQESEENPVVLQRYIDKAFEVRYTVVGEDHFVCKIESQKSEVARVDWRRYDIPSTPHSSMKPPDEIRDKVGELMSKLGLSYGALDFIVSPSGDWYFLEVNTMGQWLWIEDLTGLQISAAIAGLLTA